jgi:hypothetical protein
MSKPIYLIIVPFCIMIVSGAILKLDGMVFWIIAVVVTLLVLLVIYWAHKTKRPAREGQAAQLHDTSSAENEAIRETEKRLSNTGTSEGENSSISFELTGTGLGDVLDFIAEAGRAEPRGINIIVDRQGIEDAGISLDDPIDLDVADVSLERALQLALPYDIGYQVVDDGSVLVSSKDRLYQNLPVRHYPVDALVRLMRQGPGHGMQNGFEELQNYLERTVQSDEPWESMGGRASIAFFRPTGTMTIAQTVDGHRQVRQRLDALRQDSPGM